MTPDHAIKTRKTHKILPIEPWPIQMTNTEQETLAAELQDLAAPAPYHYMAHRQYMKEKALNSSLPYRFYLLGTEKCRTTAQHIEQSEIEGGKIVQMLHAADLLFIVTWLPEPADQNQDGMLAGDDFNAWLNLYNAGCEF